MNKKPILIAITLLTTALFHSCGQSNPSQNNALNDSTGTPVANSPTRDSIAIMTAFEALKNDKKFLRDLGLEHEKQFSWNDDFYRIIRGDIDGDGTSDALLNFVIEGRGGGNNSDVHYALLLNKENQWQYSTQFEGSIFADDRLFEIQNIENNTIKGNWIGNKNESLAPYSAAYIFKNDQIINTFTALHPTENEGRAYLTIETIHTKDYTTIPLTATRKDYEQLLGKGEISTPKEQPQCGTYFEEGTYSELQYPNLIIELNENKKAACDVILLKGSGFSVNTDKGTLTENTTLSQLKNVLNKNESWWMNEEENGEKTLIIPDAQDSDNQLHILFDKTEKLVKIDFFIPC